MLRMDGTLALADAADFVRTCLEATPLRRYVPRLDAEALERDRALRDCFVHSFPLFTTDVARWKWQYASPKELFERLLLAPHVQAVYFYRLSHQMYLRRLELLPDVIAALAKQLTGVEVYYSAEIGPGFKLIHGISTVIGARCRIGRFFTTYQDVTIGDKGGRVTGLDQRPTIGDHVIIKSGCKVLGPITIGEKTVVGANSVVLGSLPERCVAVGAPARVKISGLTDERYADYWNSFGG
jgi:serine O-acetyltransferase